MIMPCMAGQRDMMTMIAMVRMSMTVAFPSVVAVILSSGDLDMLSGRVGNKH